ncbi:MAG: SRPBCC family protein [Bacteroidota bacterium]
MKWLKYLPLIFILLPGAFFLIGILTPRFSYECVIETPTEISEAWEVFVDPSLMSEWVEGFQGMELIEGDSMQAGSRYHMLVENQGESFEMLEEVIVADPPERFSFLLENEVMFSKVKITLKRTDYGTRFTALHEIEGKNIFWKSLFPLMKGQFQAQSQEGYLRLKQLMER